MRMIDKRVWTIRLPKGIWFGLWAIDHSVVCPTRIIGHRQGGACPAPPFISDAAAATRAVGPLSRRRSVAGSQLRSRPGGLEEAGKSRLHGLQRLVGVADLVREGQEPIRCVPSGEGHAKEKDGRLKAFARRQVRLLGFGDQVDQGQGLRVYVVINVAAPLATASTSCAAVAV